MMFRLYFYWLLGIGIIILDRYTKVIALTTLISSPYHYNHYLSFDLVFNNGIAWGFFNYPDKSIFYLLSLFQALMILVIIINACYRIKKKLSIIGHIAIIAGVASNYYDRLAYSGVIDFVVISYGRYAWPVFNIADIAIVCGAISMVLWHEE